MAKQKNTKKRRKSLNMIPLMAKYEQSDLTIREFCRQHDLAHSTLNYWLKKYRKSKMPASVEGADIKNVENRLELNSFIPVKILDTPDKAEAIPQKPIIEVIYVDGTRVYLPADCGASIIRSLLPCFQP